MAKVSESKTSSPGKSRPISNTADTFINPAGFIEQHYRGYQTATSVSASIELLEKCRKLLQKQKRPILILIDMTKLTKTSSASRRVGLQGIRKVPFEKAAMYGPVWTQVLVNTLALIAGKKDKVKAFEDREEAVRWLRSKK